MTTRLQSLVATLVDARLDATASVDIRKDVWTKLIGNLSFNPVAALTYADIGRIAGSDSLRHVIRPMLVEGMAVAAAYGIEIAMTADQRIDLAKKLGSARISMHQDFEAHRKPEIDAIVGAVIELADRVSVPVPGDADDPRAGARAGRQRGIDCGLKGGPRSVHHGLRLMHVAVRLPRSDSRQTVTAASDRRQPRPRRTRSRALTKSISLAAPPFVFDDSRRGRAGRARIG